MKEIMENPVRNGYENQKAFLAYDAQNNQETTVVE